MISRLKREFARFFDIAPVLWEYEPMLSSGHFQDIIDPPGDADILVLILWSRLGTPLPEKTATREYRGIDGRMPVTGTEWEYEQAIESERKRGSPQPLVYRKFAEGIAKFSRSEQLNQLREQWEALQAFWERHFEAPGTLKAGFSRFQTLDEFETRLEHDLRELLRRRLPPQGARTTHTPGDRIDWWAGSPYLGLKAFDVEHAAVFFGRDRAEREITEALVRRVGEGTGFMLVLGASGSGKSSLVRAGLLPDLMAPGVVAGISTWRHVIVTPAELAPDPAAGLTAALFRKQALPELATIGYSADDIAAQLRAGGTLATVPLRLALERAAADDPNPSSSLRQGRLVLVLDQMEVLFTSAAHSEQTRRALDKILSSLAQSGLVWVIATMRSDFFHRVVELPEMTEMAKGLGQYHLAPVTGTEIEQIIGRPAEIAGLSFEVDPADDTSLASVIREAAARDAAALPLLSFVLDELYRRDVVTAGGNTLTYAGYRDLGQLEGAIAQHARETAETLPDELKPALRPLLLALVEIDEIKGTATARTVRRAALADTAQGDVADILVRARLLVADRNETGVTLRLAHEALLTHWKLLGALIEEDRDFLVIRRRLQLDAAAWETHSRHPDFLLPAGRRLAEAQEVLAKRRHDVDPESVVYAETSIEAEEERIAAEQRAKEAALRRDLKRVRIVAAVVSVLFVVAVIAGNFALRESNLAADREVLAQKNFTLALTEATASLNFLQDTYDRGKISADVLGTVVANSAQVVDGPPGPDDPDDATVARVKLLDAATLVGVSTGNSDAFRMARMENDLADKLIAKEPANPQWLQLWAFARGRRSGLQFRQCDCTKAVRDAEDSVAVIKKLLTSNPGNDYLHERLLTDYETITDAWMAMGDLDRAEAAGETRLADATKAEAKEPSLWLGDIVFSEERLGDIAMARGRIDEAVSHYQVNVTKADEMADRRASEENLAAQLQAHQRQGDLWLAKGDTERAATEYERYRKIAENLAEQAPKIFRFREFYMVAYQRLGDLYLKQNDPPDAVTQFRLYLSLAADTLQRFPTYGNAIYEAANAHQKGGRRAPGARRHRGRSRSVSRIRKRRPNAGAEKLPQRNLVEVAAVEPRARRHDAQGPGRQQGCARRAQAMRGDANEGDDMVARGAVAAGCHGLLPGADCGAWKIRRAVSAPISNA